MTCFVFETCLQHNVNYLSAKNTATLQWISIKIVVCSVVKLRRTNNLCFSNTKFVFITKFAIVFFGYYGLNCISSKTNLVLGKNQVGQFESTNQFLVVQ